MDTRLLPRERLAHVVVRGLTYGLLIVLTLLISLPHVFVYGLTHPPCNRPAPLASLPAPEEYWLDIGSQQTLRVWYYPSRNGAAIVTLGGIGGALGDNLPPAAFLIQQGYGVLQVDTRACASPRATVTLGYDEAADAAAALDFLAARPEVDERRMGLFGFSMGAAAAIRTAARRPDVAAVVAEGGYFNLGDQILAAGDANSLPQRFFVAAIAYSFRLQTGIDPRLLSPIDDLPAISPSPILFIYGEGEAASAHAQAQFDAAGEPKELWIVPAGSHGRNALVAPDEYFQRISEFFGRTLLK